MAPLLYLAATGMYRLLAGTEARALRVVDSELRAGLVGATWVAELDGEVAGAMVAYPYRDDPCHARRLLRAVLRHAPPWRWPRIARLHWRGQGLAPDHPPDWLYVDALATDPAHRRRGVASALLAQAERSAGRAGLPALALDTPESNEPALALYRRAGFRVAEVRPSAPPAPPAVVMLKELRAHPPAGPRRSPPRDPWPPGPPAPR